MMKWILTGMILLSFVSGLFFGRTEQVSNAALSGCGQAVELSITLLGSMCLWSGMMRVAEKSGLTEVIRRLLSPVTKLLFRGKTHARAMRAICMNMTANLLGLGNAATPLGITAMKELNRENPEPGTASADMVTFVVLNTASIQLIPTTIAALRLSHGAAFPMDILPAVLVSSLLSVSSALLMAKVLGRIPIRFFDRKSGDSKKDDQKRKNRQQKSIQTG